VREERLLFGVVRPNPSVNRPADDLGSGQSGGVALLSEPVELLFGDVEVEALHVAECLMGAISTPWLSEVKTSRPFFQKPVEHG